jgi:flagellar biosynthesis protein
MAPAEWIWKCNMAGQKAPESPKPNIAKRQQRPRSIALGYDPERDEAPRILASGQGWLSDKIIAVAREHDIPIRKDPFLVSALSALEIDETIPPELYKVVAEVLAYVYRISEKFREKYRP